MDDEQKAMWEALSTLPYDFGRDGVNWLPAIDTLYDLDFNSGNNGDVVLVKEHGDLYMSINKQWKKISGV